MSHKLHVNVHSQLTVVSSTPTEPRGQIRALTPIDHTMGSHTVHIIYYYRTSPFVKQAWYAMDLDNVRVSLSYMLSKYPRMTGRLARDGTGNWMVKYNDAGVRMFKASVETTIDEWLKFANESDERNLTVWEDMPDGDPTSWSPFRIQLSEFVGGGLAIGISFTHILADPTGATLFFKSWTDAERGEPSGHSLPMLGLPPLDNTTLPTTTKNTSITIKYLQDKSKLAPTSSKKMATATFRFSNATMKQCLSKIAEKCPDATPFDYLTALFWLQILKLKTLNAHSPTHYSISLCLDARNHLDAPIPMKFFGNALSFSKLSLKNEDLVGDVGLAEAVGLVHHHVNAIKKDDVTPSFLVRSGNSTYDIASMINWLESSPKGMDGVYPEAVQMYGPELTCVSLDHLMTPKDDSQDDIGSLIYDARLRNNEKPVHVSYHVGKAEGEGLIVIAPSPEGGVARTVTVTLPAEEIVKLCQDSVIMEMEPTMIVSGKI